MCNKAYRDWYSAEMQKMYAHGCYTCGSKDFGSKIGIVTYVGLGSKPEGLCEKCVDLEYKGKPVCTGWWLRPKELWKDDQDTTRGDEAAPGAAAE